MKCKFCDHQAPDMVELRRHASSRHKGEWEKLRSNLGTWDQQHLHELDNQCPICPHKKSHAV